jgi:hypothetical protein
MQARFRVLRSVSIGFTLLLAATFHAAAKESAGGDRPANAATQSIHDEAMRVLGNIQLTEYRHDTKINEQMGEYYCDCSAFVGYVLNRTVSKDDTKGPFHDGRKKPLARDYEKYFAALSGATSDNGRWQQVVRVADAKPGDVIAWRHKVPKPNNTGHVVIVDVAPVVEKDGLVRVGVIDSTTLSSVDLAGGKGKTGVGRRTMWFTVDKDGRPAGYVRGSRTSKPTVEDISIGRALPAAAKRVATRRAA